jgi:phage gpG-like protein
MNVEKDVNQFGKDFSTEFNSIDFKKIHSVIRTIVQSSIEENFKQNGRFGSGRFGGGTQRWKVSRRAKAQSGQTLQDTGQLAASVRVNVHAGSTPKDIVIEMGSNKPYAAIHHFGGNIPVTDKMKNYFKYRFYNAGNKQDKAKWGGLSKYAEHNSIIKMPARPFLVLQDEDVSRINKKIIEFIGRELE